MRQLHLDLAVAGTAGTAGAVMLWSGHRLLGSRWQAPPAVPRLTETGAPELLGLAASALGLVILAWWTVTLVLAFASQLLERAGHRKAGHRTGAICPGSMKRIAAAALSINVLAGITAGAAVAATPLPAPSMAVAVAPAAAVQSMAPAAAVQSMAPAGPVAMRPDDSRQPRGVTPLWSPRTGSETVQPQWKPVPEPADGNLVIPKPERSGTVPGLEAPETVVRPGDSLWSIAAANLGPFAADAEIAQEWPLWYQANREQIGQDPGLIHPGQVLRAPVRR
jgi:hypothetical protein